MKLLIVLLSIFICNVNIVIAQLELTSGYAINRNLAGGAPIQIAYEFDVKENFFTKSQLGFKYLYRFNDFVGATMKTYIWEFHQTISYEVIKKKKYIFKPNLGINYRFYKWAANMNEPLNTLPMRAWIIGLRNEELFIISNSTGENYKEYMPNNFGFSIQLQNQFKLSNKLWLHVTPFIEPDYDSSQNTGGCYVGVIFKKY